MQAVLDGNAVVIASGADGDPADMYPFAHNILVAKPETCERRKSVCVKLGKAMAEAIARCSIIRPRCFRCSRSALRRSTRSCSPPASSKIRKGTPRPPAVTKADLENAEIYNIGAGLLKPEEKLKCYDGLYTDVYVK